jgi:hypothetical protein
VADYRSQEEVEADFLQTKDPKVVAFLPMSHRTDQKIRVHVFYCVLALPVARLTVREAGRHGMHMSMRKLLEAPAGREEPVLLSLGQHGRPRVRRVLTEIDVTRQRLFDHFALDACALRDRAHQLGPNSNAHLRERHVVTR